jgi:hypothetical protein
MFDIDDVVGIVCVLLLCVLLVLLYSGALP